MLTPANCVMPHPLNRRFSLPVVLRGGRMRAPRTRGVKRLILMQHPYRALCVAHTPEPGVYNWTADWKHIVALQEGEEVARLQEISSISMQAASTPPLVLERERGRARGGGGSSG